MAHPWNEERPLSAWYPGGYSCVKEHKVSRTLRPVVDADRCIHCDMCWIYCPEGCIDRTDGISIDLAYCRGCGVCARECAKNAINMVRED